jgi:hypothetical protein
MADETIESAIESNATGPRRASDDNGSFEQHPLQDQIAADKYIRQQRAATRTALPIKHVKNVMPGSV